MKLILIEKKIIFEMGNEMNTKREYDENVYSISKTNFKNKRSFFGTTNE